MMMAARYYACAFLLGLTLALWLESSCISATEEDTSDSPSLPNEDQESESNDTATKKADSPSYYNPPFDPDNPSEPIYSKSGQRMFTQNELAAHKSGGPLKPMMLAVMGRVFDVDKGRAYSPGGGYDFFTGLDGSRAFVTGEFSDEGLTDDLSGLSPLQVKEIDDWVKFYNKDYTYVGKLIGRYYDRDGNPTKAWYKYRKAVEEADAIKEDQDADKKKFPPCNSRFTPAEGGTVSCSKKSGGIERDWVGVPRRYFAPGATNWRCACVNEPDLSSPHMRLYPECDPKADSCKVIKDKIKDEL